VADPPSSVEESLRSNQQIEGLEETLSRTLSDACWKAFQRKYPEIPCDERDYYLSKRFQFFHLALLNEGDGETYYETVGPILENLFGSDVSHLSRILVTDAYSRRCAITGERTLPVLEAAHLKPYSVVKRHELSSGLLLRSDLHRLFDDGYLTMDPKDYRLIVSKRIREEFENGKDYYRLEGQVLREPIEAWARPLAENLEFHAYNVSR